jgi:polysaccharide biosynthesis protein PelF
MADICLFVEGAYPYVTGGVSSWVHSLVANLHDLTFSIVYIGARPDPQRKPLYELPKNVVEFREVFIHDISRIHEEQVRKRVSPAWNEMFALHEALAVGKVNDPDQLLPMLQRLDAADLGVSDLFYARESWKLLLKLYELHAPRESFTDFFWTFRFAYLPIFTLFETSVPDASVYHSVSTGFCGLLGSLAKARTGRPLLLTEHGIYTREREMEIIQSPWMDRPAASYHLQAPRMGFFQQWWFNLYRFMESVSYATADSLISIAGVNQHYQLARGADPKKLRLIPNGIDVRRIGRIRKEKSETDTGPDTPFRVGFVGRVVSIKDVKTLIHALKIASTLIPRLEAYVVGPTTEEPEYFGECLALIEMLDMQDMVHFTGPADVQAYYRRLDVVVLTSLSEGQPLVVLEANCAGIPVIATDVGACRELLTGGTSPKDRALGESGLVTPVASPSETAAALVLLQQNEDLRKRMGRAGKRRVSRYYNQDQLYQTYRKLYRHSIAQ